MTRADNNPLSSRQGTAEWIVERRRWIMLVWTAAALALLPLAPRAASHLQSGDGRAEGSESARVDQELRTRFGSPFANSALLVIDGIPVTDSSGKTALGEIVDVVNRVPDVIRVRSYLNAGSSEYLLPNGTFLVAGLETDSLRPHGAITALRAATSDAQDRLRARFPGATLDWTGAIAFDYDVQRMSATDAAAAERRVLPVTLILLVIVFGSVAAALLPVGAGAFAIGMSLGVVVLISRYWTLTALTQNVISMIGLGLGIDYALLLTSRFREGMGRGLTARAAALEAAHHGGHTVLLSGMAVVIGFAALLIVPAVELRSIATGGILVVTVSMLIATTLLPGVLAMLGPRIEVGRLWRRAPSNASAVRWQRWGRWIMAHPYAVLLVAGAPLVALAWQARRLSTDLPSGAWLPAQMESMRGATALERMGRVGMVQTMRVVVELPTTSVATTEAGWQGVYALSKAVLADPRVASVSSLPLVFDSRHPNAVLLTFLPADVRAHFMSRDDRLALIEIVPAEREKPSDLIRYVRELRKADVARMTGIPAARLRVGGIPAANADYQDAIGGSAVRVIALIVGCTFLALLVGFRSPLVAAKAVLLNLLSVGAAMGAAVLVFQDGHGAQLIGLAAPVDGLFPAVPIIVFCIVFGLSMDYEVFLVSRVAECVDTGMPDDEALVEGLSRTAGVITSAAAVMVVVFAGFALSDFLIVKILGFALATAVLLDATLVRMAVGPALLRLAGRWNWWPRIRAR